MKKLKSKRMKRHSFLSDFIYLIGRLLPLITLITVLWAQNNFIITKGYVYSVNDLPKSFVGYKIVHISDICNSNVNIVSRVKKEKPDVIILSGGYTDAKGEYSNSISQVNKLSEIAPVYYIYNKEDTSDILSGVNATNIVDNIVNLSPISIDVNTFINKNYGNKILKEAEKGNEEAKEYIEYVSTELANTQSETLNLLGLGIYDTDSGPDDAKEKLYSLIGENNKNRTFALLGNIDLLDEVCKTNINTLFIGGTFGTNLISKDYTKGLYGNNGVDVFVSGGIGKHKGVLRVFNFPEMHSLTLSDGTIREKNALADTISLFFDDVGTIFDNDGGFHEYTYKYD